MSTRTQTLQDYLPADPADLAAEFARQRDNLVEALVDELQELSDKYDVPERAHEVKKDAEELAEELAELAQEGMHELKERATDSDGRPRPVVVIGAGVAVVAVAVLVARKRRKRKEEQR